MTYENVFKRSAAKMSARWHTSLPGQRLADGGGFAGSA
jgi:hypothetical protein